MSGPRCSRCVRARRSWSSNPCETRPARPVGQVSSRSRLRRGGRRRDRCERDALADLVGTGGAVVELPYAGGRFRGPAVPVADAVGVRIGAVGEITGGLTPGPSPGCWVSPAGHLLRMMVVRLVRGSRIHAVRARRLLLVRGRRTIRRTGGAGRIRGAECAVEPGDLWRGSRSAPEARKRSAGPAPFERVPFGPSPAALPALRESPCLSGAVLFSTVPRGRIRRP